MQSFTCQSDLLGKGYTIVRNALTCNEVESLRISVLRFFNDGDYRFICGGKTRPDAFTDPELKDILWLLKKETIVDAIKQIAGSQITFCHHSDVHLNLNSGWHKDCENYHTLDCWSATNEGETYGVYKVAIYLQEHSGASGYGLKVKKGSHLSPSLSEGVIEVIDTKLGDVIIFDCRLTHMGQEDFLFKQHPVFRKLMKAGLRLSQSERGRYEIRSIYRKLLGIPDRASIFFTFGKCNEFTNEHIKGNRLRQNKQLESMQSPIPSELIKNLQAVGITY